MRQENATRGEWAVGEAVLSDESSAALASAGGDAALLASTALSSMERPRAMAHRVRAAAIWLHRWVGLALTGFLLVAGVTGSIIAFYVDLDRALNPELLRAAPPAPGTPLLDPLELQGRIQAQLAERHRLHGAVLDLREGEAVNYWIDERENFFDPYTGRWLGSRRFGDIGEGKKNLLTFIYRLHHSLALGEVGVTLFGIVALLWTLDCFVGAYLTFPVAVPAAKGRSRQSWLARWAPAWMLQMRRSFSLVFTWHRASGLWVWGVLLMFGWSAVALNLGDAVYDPVMTLVLPRANEAELPELDPPRRQPRLDFHAARMRGRAWMARESEQRGFRVIREKALFYEEEHGTYAYNVESTLDIGERLAETSVVFDGDDGAWRAFYSPTTQGARTAVDRWLVALHFGTVREGGVVYRAFVCLMGLVVAVLGVTGVWIWWRKRSKRAKVGARSERARVVAARGA